MAGQLVKRRDVYKRRGERNGGREERKENKRQARRQAGNEVKKEAKSGSGHLLDTLWEAIRFLSLSHLDTTQAPCM